MRTLGEEIRRREALWDAGQVDRAATRQAHAAAGWAICPHPNCPPWSCRGKEDR